MRLQRVYESGRGSKARREKLVEFINRRRDSITLKPDQRIVYRDEWDTPKSRIAGVRKLMEQIAGLAA